MKRKITYLFCFITLVSCFVTSSCSDDLNDQNEIENASKNELIESEGFKSALNVITNFKKKIDSANPKLRSSEDIIVESVSKTTFTFNIKQNQLRSTSSEKDTTNKTSLDLYTVTFRHGEEKGYSIATGDERIERIYAYVESGQLSDTTYNIGLAMTLSAIPDIVEENIIEYYNSQQADVIYPLGGIPISEFCKTLYTWNPTMQGNPAWEPDMYMTTEWNQNAPYNLNMSLEPESCGNHFSYEGRCPAGCVAIAGAQAIAFLGDKYSPIGTSSQGKYHNLVKLRSMKTVSVDDTLYSKKVAIFVDSVGKGCYMKYGCESSAYLTNLYQYLKNNWGFDLTFGKDRIDWKKVFLCRTKGYPTIVSGKTPRGEGHAWVIDNIRCEWKACPVIFPPRPASYDALSYFKVFEAHCNWGWGPNSSNGWFAANIYNIAKSKKDFTLETEIIYINGN